MPLYGEYNIGWKQSIQQYLKLTFLKSSGGFDILWSDLSKKIYIQTITIYFEDQGSY